MFWRKQRATAVAPQPDFSKGLLLDAVSVSYADKPVFGPVSLRLRESSIGLVGHNGCGKSTMLRLLAALQPADQGQVYAFGLNAQDYGDWWPHWVGVVFQNADHQLIFPTVEEELAFGLQQLQRDDANQQASALLHQTGREHWANRRVHELSGGEKQWLCWQAILLMQPRLLLLDEPYSGLDLRQKIQARRTLQDTTQQHIIASHDPGHLQHCERILWLEEGQIKQDGSPEAVLPQYLEDCGA